MSYSRFLNVPCNAQLRKNSVSNTNTPPSQFRAKNLLWRNAFSNQIVTPPPFSSDAAEPVLRCPFSETHFCICRSNRSSVRLQGKVFRSAYTVWRQAPARKHSVPDHWAEHSPENTGTWHFRSKASPASRTRSPEEGSRTPGHGWHISESPVSESPSFLSQSVPVRFFPLAFLLVK